MKPRFYSSVIFVKDIELSKEFYCQRLNQTIKHDFGKNVELHGGLTLWEVQPGHIIPEKLGKKSVGYESANRFELYFEFDDIEEIVIELIAANVEFLHEIHEESWGQRTVRFFDPDHHLIEIGETLQCFTRRLFKIMQSIDQVSKKTGIPRETVSELIEGISEEKR